MILGRAIQGTSGVVFPLVIGAGGILVIGTQHLALFLVWACLNTAGLVILAASLAVVVVECVPAAETGRPWASNR